MGDSKLTEERLRAIIEALQLPMSEKDAAEASGISYRTFCKWKARARAVAEILPADWPKLKYAELLACAEELEIDLSRASRTGRGRRLTREDLIRVLRNQAEVYVELLQKLDASAPGAKQAILRVVDNLIHGRVQIRRTRTTQVFHYVTQEDGSMAEMAGTDVVVVTEVVDLPPDRQAALKMLEMRWPAEFGARRNGKGGDPQEPGAAAKEVNDTVHRMLSTVPPPAGYLPEHVPEDAEE